MREWKFLLGGRVSLQVRDGGVIVSGVTGCFCV